MRLRVRILVRILVVRSFADRRLWTSPMKGFTAKKSVVLNDDEPRPVPIPKDFAHLTKCKIYESYIEFIQCRSDALVEMSEYTLKSKLLQVKQLNKTLRCVIFQSSFNCSFPECLLF